MLHRPESGWDPISDGYAVKYSDLVASQFEADLISRLDARLGGLSGKRVLDLGGGPGHYTVALAERGAAVTWHDVSATYRRSTQDRAAAAGVQVIYSLGYFEEAERLVADPFDLVFNRVCWNYSMADRPFAELIYRLLKPGGTAYIDAANSEFSNAKGGRPLIYWMNQALWLKIGHPHPPRGRVAALMNMFPLRSLEVDYSAPDRDIVFAVKAHGISKGARGG